MEYSGKNGPELLCRLTHDQTRYIFETNTIGASKESINVDDIIETANHFRCIDLIIDKATSKLTESFIKELHFLLKSGTSNSRKDWFNVGNTKSCLTKSAVMKRVRLPPWPQK